MALEMLQDGPHLIGRGPLLRFGLVVCRLILVASS
jgi:hypothetical protein